MRERQMSWLVTLDKNVIGRKAIACVGKVKPLDGRQEKDDRPL